MTIYGHHVAVIFFSLLFLAWLFERRKERRKARAQLFRDARIAGIYRRKFLIRMKLNKLSACVERNNQSEYFTKLNKWRKDPKNNYLWQIHRLNRNKRVLEGRAKAVAKAAEEYQRAISPRKENLH